MANDTPELELIAHDALNPSIGYVLRFNRGGVQQRTIELDANEAYLLMQQTIDRALILSKTRGVLD